MDKHHFDALVRSSAATPRRRVLGGVLAIARGGGAAAVAGEATLAACKGDFCGGKKNQCNGLLRPERAALLRRAGDGVRLPLRHEDPADGERGQPPQLRRTLEPFMNFLECLGERSPMQQRR